MTAFRLSSFPGGGGEMEYLHVKVYGDVLHKWVSFSQKKSSDMGPILVNKILRSGFHIMKIIKQNKTNKQKQTNKKKKKKKKKQRNKTKHKHKQ